MPETQIGVVKHFFDKISVALIEITEGEVTIGDNLKIKGTTSDMPFTVETLRVDKDEVPKGIKGQTIGTRVPGKARINDKVFKITA
jgi:U32 family peptidase